MSEQRRVAEGWRRELQPFIIKGSCSEGNQESWENGHKCESSHKEQTFCQKGSHILKGFLRCFVM